MNATEMREKSAEDLNKQLLTLREEQFKLRMQKSTGQLGQTHLLKQFDRPAPSQPIKTNKAPAAPFSRLSYSFQKRQLTQPFFESLE